MAPKKKKKKSWRSSDGRRLLIEDVRSGTIPEDMDWEVAFATRVEFNVFPSEKKTPKELFKGRLERARKRDHEKQTRAATELALMQQDLASRPRAATNRHSGLPSWEESVAQTLLKKDVANKKHETMTRTEFHQSRPQYQVYPKRFIARKIEQELSLQKFLKQYRERVSRGYWTIACF